MPGHQADGCCFPGEAQVQSTGGVLKMSEVQIGDFIMAGRKDGSVEFSEVYAWGHRDVERHEKYLKIAAGSHSMWLSANHLVAVADSKCSGCFRFIRACEVSTKDTIYTMDGLDRIKKEQVISITTEEKLGVFAPFTKNGTVIVDGILASCYSEVGNHKAAHFCLSWLRAAYKMGMFIQKEEGKMCHGGAEMRGAHKAVQKLASLIGYTRKTAVAQSAGGECADHVLLHDCLSCAQYKTCLLEQFVPSDVIAFFLAQQDAKGIRSKDFKLYKRFLAKMA